MSEELFLYAFHFTFILFFPIFISVPLKRTADMNHLKCHFWKNGYVRNTLFYSDCQIGLSKFFSWIEGEKYFPERRTLFSSLISNFRYWCYTVQNKFVPYHGNSFKCYDDNLIRYHSITFIIIVIISIVNMIFINVTIM